MKKDYIDVEAVAKLAKLELSADERDELKKDMDSVISFANILDAIDTNGINAAEHITKLVNVMREDEVEEKYTAEEMIRSAKTRCDGFITVPTVVEG